MLLLRECSVDELTNRLAKNDLPQLILLDVREETDRSMGNIAGSQHLPYSQLISWQNSLALAQNTPLVLYCQNGVYSKAAAAHLMQLGFHDVRSLRGGFSAWMAQSKTLASTLTATETQRYLQQLNLAEIGAAGQQKLKNSRILIIGAGGLGSPAATYLAAAGVGKLIIVDDDKVELSNLSRQILHDSRSLGMKKVTSAQIRLQAINPEIQVIAMDERFSEKNARELSKDINLIIDGSDNLATRYLINDLSLELQIPWIYAAVERFQGQLSFFNPPQTSCYRCLFPTPPTTSTSNCTATGVLPVVPGIIGLLQANEALKFILGVGDLLEDQLFIFEALKTNFRTLKIQRNPKCSCAQLRIQEQSSTHSATL